MVNEIAIIKIGGMSCEHCVNGLKKVIGELRGVNSVEVSLENKTATVEYDPKEVKLGYIKVIIEDEGYTVS